MKTKLILLIICLSYSVFAQGINFERIISFHSEIVLNEDASMIVTESIKVYAAGYKIRRGIYRDFPTSYKDKYNNDFKVKFELIQVSRDGNSEDYHTENLSNGIRIYLGSEDVFLQPGVYEYKIIYKTSRQIGFYKNFDELYWNVTGNGWDFIIEEVIAEVILPPATPISEIKTFGYTGPFGSVETDYNVKINNKRIEFRTTRQLNSLEGLTIGVQWPKGFIKEPSSSKKMMYFVEDNISLIIALAGLIVLFVFYLLVWFKLGVDPKKGTIIPLFDAPNNLSPASVRYITKMSFDNKTFAAALLSMAVKGYLKINEDNQGYSLIKTGKGFDLLSADEKKVAEKLVFSSSASDELLSDSEVEKLEQSLSELRKKNNFFTDKLADFISKKIIRKKNESPVESGTGQILEMKQKNHPVFRSAISEITKSLKNSYEKSYFVTNRKFFVFGILFSFFTLIISGINGSEEMIFMLIWLSFWTIGVVVLLFQVYRAWKGVLNGKGYKTASIGASIFLTLFAIPFFIGELVGGFFFIQFSSPAMIILLALIFTVNIVFYHLLKAPTLLGRKALDQIEGFKLYLSVAEKDRLDMIRSPEKTPELFEKFLPYAFALDVENEWSEKFADILKSVSTADTKTYSPRWYSGTNWSALNASAFTSSFSSGFSSAVSSSSTAPGSSSGGGGGGSSGGGGGGGGGGGW
jgi:uncharacterized membrane protein YgcG